MNGVAACKTFLLIMFLISIRISALIPSFVRKPTTPSPRYCSSSAASPRRCCISRWHHHHRRPPPPHRRSESRQWLLSLSDELVEEKIFEKKCRNNDPDCLLIHWKGDVSDGYSFQFRQLEFCSALSVVLQRPLLGDPTTELPIKFINALEYNGCIHNFHERKLIAYNEAMQFISPSTDDNADTEKSIISTDAVIQAANRCSLVHAVYKIVAVGDTYEDLGSIALDNGGFEDMTKSGVNQNKTWCFRARCYGDELLGENEQRGEGKGVRYGGRARSMKAERDALLALKPLLLKFAGKVNLDEPDIKIYIFDGLKGGKPVLGRRMTTGPQISSIDPNTRICVTSTPLDPIVAFTMCNIAGVSNTHKILDPFAGSCATLLAATMIAPKCHTVGIEIAHNGIVNRDDIYRDFSTRGLRSPLALIQGDSTNDDDIRDRARGFIGNDESFDAIITDPPYGIRESKNSNSISPLSDLFLAMSKDRSVGKPLLKLGGKLVAFVPVFVEEETLDDCMPPTTICEDAGLRLDVAIEQPLNSKLSRWLVSYTCVE